MSDKMARNIRNRHSYTANVAAIYRVARVEHITQQEIDEKIQVRVRDDKKWTKSPVWVRDYVEGYINACRDELSYSALVFAYDVHGTRYILGSPEYRQLDPGVVCREHTWNGYVWRNDPTKMYFGVSKS